MAKRTLILLRHAKSDWPYGVDDEQRPLAGRGRRDAKAAAGFLAKLPAPQLVFCSPALRTRQTWQLAGQGVAKEPPVRYEDDLYGATWKDLLNVVRVTPAWVEVVLVVGHEPTMSTTVEKLAGPGSSKPALRHVATKYPTSGIAVLAVPGRWADLRAGGAALRSFDVPRG
ncbi:SixA phosphatase family protein [Spongisporangium articulatum]|uniref:SixA phosphatase family protein n=1 Tax=Spongisporangium articulatum TaxID=3362603 RepID=A0ABW8ARL5_9ACTN